LPKGAKIERLLVHSFFIVRIAHDERGEISKNGTTYPKNAPWDGPCVHPYGRSRNDAENMGQGARSALGITVKFTP
jgi:hypothetical protein